MSLFRKFNKFAIKKGKRVNQQQLLIAQAFNTKNNVRNLLSLEEVREHDGINYSLSAQDVIELGPRSGDKISALQSENKGFSGLRHQGDSDFSKINSENFVHSAKREDPNDFRLEELEEVESVVLEAVPPRNKNPAIDRELVEFFGFITKKLQTNTEGLQTAK